jgi:hypothetical protein
VSNTDTGKIGYWEAMAKGSYRLATDRTIRLPKIDNGSGKAV